MQTIKLSGKIVFPKDISATECKVYIKVQDTSIADAPAETVAETELDYSPKKLSAGRELPFELNFKTKMNKTADYTLFVHVDVDNDKSLSKNDFMHDQSYPITYGNPSQNLLIRLKKVL